MPRNNNFGHWLLIAAFSVIAMLPAYFNGIPGGNDQHQHFQFAWTIYNAVAGGEIYPSLAGETNHGFGDLGLRFYPPLTYYALSASFFVIRDWYFASLLAFTFAFFAGGVGIYVWAREDFEPQPALIAAALYVFAPYHLNQLYNNALFAEFFAMAVVPYCFLFLTRVCRNGRWSSVPGLAFSYALLILTHLPLTIICSIAFAVYAVLLLKRTVFRAAVVQLVSAVLVAITMTAFYWSRWLPELAWVKHSSPAYFSATWDYQANFLLLPSHFLFRADDVLNLWLADLFLIVILLITIPTFVFFFRDRTCRSPIVTTSAAVFGLAIFMATPTSSFIWDQISILQKVQFPWRWLGVICPVGAILASVGIDRAATLMKEIKSLLLPICLGAILVIFVFTGAFVTKGAAYSSRAEINKMMQTIPASEGCECWWPIWADREALDQVEPVAAADRKVDINKWTVNEKQFHVDAGSPLSAMIKTFYYPRWQAEINASPAPVENSANGAISLALPADASDVKLTFREPAYVRTANVVSFATFILCFIAALLLRRRFAYAASLRIWNTQLK